MDAFLSDRIAEAAILLRDNGYPDVVKWMMAKEKKQHDAERKPRARKVSVTNTVTGKRSRGGDFYLAMGIPKEREWR